MRQNIVLNNANIDGTNFYRSVNTCEHAAFIPGIVSKSAGTEKYFSGSLNFGLLLKQPLIKALISGINSLVFAVKVIVLTALSVTYFVIGGLAALLYLILYDKLFKTLFMAISCPSLKFSYPKYFFNKTLHFSSIISPFSFEIFPSNKL